MTLAYGRTIHKFQGQTAGPVESGKAKNTYEAIICDPDEHKYEAKFMGLFYTALSRATTLGEDNGIGSAIYFSGTHFREDRVRNLGKKCRSDEDFENIQKRTKWVDFLRRNTVKLRKPNKKIERVLDWCSVTRIEYDSLYRRIREFQRSNRHRSAESFYPV